MYEEKSILEIFQLDPEYKMKSRLEFRPRSPQAVLVDGVVVGYIKEEFKHRFIDKDRYSYTEENYEDRYGRVRFEFVRYVEAVDSDIQHKLNEWFDLYIKEQKRQKKVREEKARKEQEKKIQEKEKEKIKMRNEARRVIGLPPIGEE